MKRRRRRRRKRGMIIMYVVPAILRGSAIVLYITLIACSTH
jgi:hypothetical protein